MSKELSVTYTWKTQPIWRDISGYSPGCSPSRWTQKVRLPWPRGSHKPTRTVSESRGDPRKQNDQKGFKDRRIDTRTLRYASRRGEKERDIEWIRKEAEKSRKARRSVRASLG